jgi:DNA sulfur modification protein DndD
MRLLSIELSDFRGFYGTKRIDLAAGDQKRVTIFHGENGAGKTNLLNAVHWCMTGSFTPRFQESRSLVNREAVREGRRTCYVEMVFRDEAENGGREYRVRRPGANEVSKPAEVFEIEAGNSKPIANAEALLAKFLPKGLVSWFFFDAEAIGSLELSGSQNFKTDLRRTLGFDLVDKLLVDLDLLLNKRHKDIAAQVKDKKLQDIVTRIENIDLVLPDQEAKLENAQRRFAQLNTDLESTLQRLQKLPKAEPLQRERRDVEQRKQRLQQTIAATNIRVAQLIGRAAPELLLRAPALALEDQIQEREDRGKLPAPYSDQLIKDIESDGVCICGRTVEPGSSELHRLHTLLHLSSTPILNQRIRSLRYLIRAIEDGSSTFPEAISAMRSDLVTLSNEIGGLEQRAEELTAELEGIDDTEVQRLEAERRRLMNARDEANAQTTLLRRQIDENRRERKDLEAQRSGIELKQKISAKLKTEADKVKRLRDFIGRSLADQERQALLILSHELNLVLHRYLTKHYKAKIDPSNYSVLLVDQEGKTVGHSTGEGQVLKFAFIATVVALAARKTQQKVQWMAEPTIAPLVLDAPFSALDPEYQGSVARNLAKQSTQLVLMLSSAAWGEKVAEALEGQVGKRYLIVSHESGPRGEKPIKTLQIHGNMYPLNHYDAGRAESTIVEVPV